jgi:2-oxoglutarate dehydrogenase E1 component
MSEFSSVFNAHPSYIESMYQRYLNDHQSVESDWAAFFKGFDFAADRNGVGGQEVGSGQMQKEFAVLALINGYRDRAHKLSTTNPLKPRKDRRPHLDLADFGLSDADLDTAFASGVAVGKPGARLRDILQFLQQVYCGNIGFEVYHIEDVSRREWLIQRIESRDLSDDFGFSADKKRRILEKINGAVGFEQFLHTKFVGQKRFSLEGGESAIAALDAMIESAVDWPTPVKEVVIGMAHRGRLNVLVNILGKTYEQVFTEFEGKTLPDQSFGSGDVKYHLGYSSQVSTAGGKEVYVKLLPNPSHLEAIDPVVEGFSRAKADILYGSEYDHILPVLIHGDAALAGQGVVYEVIQMSQLKGYYTGGTIHLVINNQIGFTTSWEDGRSSDYCSSVAAVVQAPVIHVNGDDAEAVVYAMELATAYRQTFNTDVFVDIVCYRKYGHNESDEPRFTQPDLYAIITNHPNPREIYSRKLIERGYIDAGIAREMEERYRGDLQARLDEVRQKPLPYTYQQNELAWKNLRIAHDDADFQESPETGISPAVITKLLDHLLALPKGFKPLGQIVKLLEGQRKLVSEGQIDWALGELMAYGSILLEGRDVRISGQDVKRGTFSHRHVTAMDAANYRELNRLEGISDTQGRFFIYNSLLSEYAVMGFEYGYSLATPDALVVWEAQFGDFANGASTMIDQFILAGEAKWYKSSGLTLLLPHGYEGQGPEHSSARMERFLQGCAQNNIAVVNVTDAANFFHLLRRQLARPFRKPLVVMSPKSTLRAPFNLGSLSALETGNRFRELIDDASADPGKVKRLLICSGKVYYDLAKKKADTKREDVAVVRLEQVYPFPAKQFEALLARYSKATLYWVQEEPANMGAWGHLVLTQSAYGWTRVSRPFAASPATGFSKKHAEEQAALVDEAFGGR